MLLSIAGEVCSQPDVLGANEASYLLSTVILHYLDFSRFALPSPVFINIVREPLDRLVSYYYFLRYGDDFRPKLVRRKGNTETFDDCVERARKTVIRRIFCFNSLSPVAIRPSAENLGSRRALEQATRNLVDHYLVVGITEQLADFVNVLELTLPSFFKGAIEIFLASDRIRRTQNNAPPFRA